MSRWGPHAEEVAREHARHRGLCPADGLLVPGSTAPRTALRKVGDRVAVALRPPLRTRYSEPAVDGSVDAGDRAAEQHRTAASRTSGAVQPVSASGTAGQDGDDARPDLRGPAATRHRQRFHRGRTPAGGAGVGQLRRAVGAVGRDARDPRPGLRRGQHRLPRRALHRQRAADQSRSGATATPADHRRRGGRKVHPATGRPLRRRVERPHLCARRTRTQAVGTPRDL